MTCVAVVIKAQLALDKLLHDMMHDRLTKLHDRLTKQACRLSNQKAASVSIRLCTHPQRLPQKAVISAQCCLWQGCALF